MPEHLGHKSCNTAKTLQFNDIVKSLFTTFQRQEAERRDNSNRHTSLLNSVKAPKENNSNGNLVESNSLYTERFPAKPSLTNKNTQTVQLLNLGKESYQSLHDSVHIFLCRS